MRSTVLAITASLLAACTQPPPTNAARGAPDAPTFSLTGDREADWASILRIEEQAKTLIKADGCTSADQCRTAPVGSRGCGGPRYYLVYCARTTDSAALYRKLAEVEAAERAYNERYQVVSTCEFRMPPSVGITGGVCASRVDDAPIR
jgi:hypothetical protein